MNPHSGEVCKLQTLGGFVQSNLLVYGEAMGKAKALGGLERGEMHYRATPLTTHTDTPFSFGCKPFRL